jgi:calcium-dependent protein kinase
MYVLLCGYPPFSGDTDAEVLGKVRLGNFTFPSADWNNISQDAKDLISQLLKMNTRDRVNAEQALSCDWIKNKAPKAKNISLQSGFVDNLRGFRSQNKLKKAALQIIAGQLNESQIKRLRETFQALDDNGDGFLTAAEMKEGMTKSGLNEVPPDLQAILEGVDADGSGKIDYTEFLAATLDKKLYLQEQQCWSAFRVFDKNGDGTISLDELKHVLDNGEVADALAGQDLEALLREVDTSGDGEIDFDEFMAMMRKGTGAAH